MLHFKMCSIPLQYFPVRPREVMEVLRLVRCLDPQAMLGCPRCLEGNRGAVPEERLNWKGGAGRPLTTARPQIPAGRGFAAHLEEVHGLDAESTRRKELPIILWSPGAFQTVDLLIHYIVEEIAVSNDYQ